MDVFVFRRLFRIFQHRNHLNGTIIIGLRKRKSPLWTSWMQTLNSNPNPNPWYDNDHNLFMHFLFDCVCVYCCSPLANNHSTFCWYRSAVKRNGTQHHCYSHTDIRGRKPIVLKHLKLNALLYVAEALSLSLFCSARHCTASQWPWYFLWSAIVFQFTKNFDICIIYAGPVCTKHLLYLWMAS